MNPSNNEKDSAVKAKSLFKANPTCFLCNSRLHLAYRCPMTRLIRDKNIQIPLEFCIVHCEKISEKCTKITKEATVSPFQNVMKFPELYFIKIKQHFSPVNIF